MGHIPRASTRNVHTWMGLWGLAIRIKEVKLAVEMVRVKNWGSCCAIVTSYPPQEVAPMQLIGEYIRRLVPDSMVLVLYSAVKAMVLRLSG